MTLVADIYQGTALVAHFERTLSGVALHLLPDVRLENGQLATSLVPNTNPVETTDLPPFFLNLLPEGARLRLLLEASKSRDDSLALLLKTGWDTIGDVSVLPHGASLGEHAASVPQSRLNEVRFWDLFYQGVGKNADASIPGVQEKISSSTAAFGVRTESIPSAILKLNPENFPRLVHNEHFFLCMAKACGLDSNQSRLVSDRTGEAGLLVTRFDRIKEGKAIQKLHQEDACQLLNAVPANKYSLTMTSIADAVANVSSAPAVEIGRLLRLYAFSYIIGNSDLHAKNISLFWTKVVRLTPAYDLLSTLPYPQLDTHMALPLEGKDDNFWTSDLVAFGLRYRVPERATKTMIENLCVRAEPWIGKVAEIGFGPKTTERMEKEIATRIGNLRR